MWKKYLIIILLFYLFALLQNSFFTHFSLFETVPNLVFILFFLLVFFENNPDHPFGHAPRNYQIIFIAAAAGIFLDIFSYTYLGQSIILLIIIGFLLKNTQSLLKNREDRYPFIYFLPLFVIFLLAYNLLLSSYLYFLDPNKIIISIGTKTIFSSIYSLLIASVFFHIYKKILASSSKQ